eukprot:13761-Heterococcus_DN1.PRE.1
MLRCEENVCKLIGSRVFKNWYKVQTPEIRSEARLARRALIVNADEVKQIVAFTSSRMSPLQKARQLGDGRWCRRL